MIKPVLYMYMVVILWSCTDRSEGMAAEFNYFDSLDTSIEFDSLLAKKNGADEYGMRKYVIAFLKKGPNKFEKKKRSELNMAHQKNIHQMGKDGKLLLVGPFIGNDGDLRGIYIFNVENLEEARELTRTDPAIQAGMLKMELIEWYGSAALMEVHQIHERLAKKKFF